MARCYEIPDWMFGALEATGVLALAVIRRATAEAGAYAGGTAGMARALGVEWKTAQKVLAVLAKAGLVTSETARGKAIAYRYAGDEKAKAVLSDPTYVKNTYVKNTYVKNTYVKNTYVKNTEVARNSMKNQGVTETDKAAENAKSPHTPHDNNIYNNIYNNNPGVDSKGVVGGEKDAKDVRPQAPAPPEREKGVAPGKRETAAPAPAPKRFVKPSVDEVRAYCEERGNGINPQAFIDFYESKGWVVGKSPMKDWKAAVRTWENRDGRRAREPAGPRPQAPVGKASQAFANLKAMLLANNGLTEQDVIDNKF